MSLDRVRIIAHRGNSRALPENTMAAFRSAVLVGAHMLELDVRLSREGAPVVIHDEDVSRTTTGSGLVSRMSAPELARLGVPALEDVLALGTPLNVEIKDPAAIPAVVELVHGRSDVVLSSFDLDELDFLRRLQPALPLGYLAQEEGWADALARAAAAEAWSLNCPASIVTAEVVAAAHAAGTRIVPFTVNEAAEARLLFGLGVDAVITDDPASTLAIL